MAYYEHKKGGNCPKSKSSNNQRRTEIKESFSKFYRRNAKKTNRTTDKGDFGMSKYIIKNCPNYRDREVDYTCTVEVISSDCHNCTDCVMKKIVEKCRETCKKRCTNDCFGTKKHCGYGQILQLLDIEECE